VPLDQTPGPAPTPSAAASAQATPGADPQTAAMGGPAATAMPADGVAAPTELQRFFEETPSTASSGSAAQDGQPAPGGTSSSAAPAGTNEKVSALPAVRNPGDPEGARLLAQRSLEVPVAGIEPASLSDQFDLSRGTRKHEAIDIVAPTGTPVVAVDDGRIAKLFTSKAGGLTIYQFDRDARLAYYYAHLHGYARHVREGMDVKRGELIGYVGATGNADVKTPHLHFAVFKLGNPPKWWQGDAVNPYPALARAQPSDQVAAR
ncbi:MAG TPA: M23 family metallopeptidase, partial [Ramlibacter sp.]